MPVPDRKHFSSPVRLALLERDAGEQDDRLDRFDVRLDRIETTVDDAVRKLETVAVRLGIYVTISATLAGALVTGLTTVLVRHFL